MTTQEALCLRKKMSRSQGSPGSNTIIIRGNKHHTLSAAEVHKYATKFLKMVDGPTTIALLKSAPPLDMGICYHSDYYWSNHTASAKQVIAYCRENLGMRFPDEDAPKVKVRAVPKGVALLVETTTIEVVCSDCNKLTVDKSWVVGGVAVCGPCLARQMKAGKYALVEVDPKKPVTPVARSPQAMALDEHEALVRALRRGQHIENEYLRRAMLSGNKAEVDEALRRLEGVLSLMKAHGIEKDAWSNNEVALLEAGLVVVPSTNPTLFQ